MGDGQPKGPTHDKIKLEQFARKLLSEVLPRSIEERQEYGAIICKNERTGILTSTKLRHSTESDTSVDVGQDEPNCGCPNGTTPVAFYHTHPIDAFYDGHDVFRGSPDFSRPQDTTIATNYQLVGFLGSFDGKFRRYDPPVLETKKVEGKEVQVLPTDSKGQLLMIPPGETVILNGTLPTQPPKSSLTGKGSLTGKSALGPKSVKDSLRDPKRVLKPASDKR